ncbi:uncharacterized protein E6C27_scaffold979G00300 [Cucumis melo var. makuwa]|uniref:DUF4216 domain-containing protein n=1 Tax=Cucumis melo var. makuwa TaxID=1194695 RepID=A0A5A7VLJ0_CUCMM|nr:uncharacterized protein E6C27_scaffold979G00300 [Cucumis melo var. makuwa]
MDDVLRHPVDAEGWKHFDSEFSEFVSDQRNVRLGLASDRFNSFEHMGTVYNMWPAVLIPYNFSPWKCMKESNFFMSLLTPGPRSPYEAKVTGTINYSWMYPIERSLRTIETRFSRDKRNDDSIPNDEVADGLIQARTKKHRTTVKLGYKSLNTSWFPEESVILTIQAHQVFYIDDLKNGVNWKVVQMVQNKCIWNVLKVDDVEDQQLNVPKIVVGHHVADHVENETLYCKVDIDPTMVDKSMVYISTGTMSNFPVDFDESDDLFDFNAKEFNIVQGTSSVSNTSDVSQPATPTPRRQQHSKNLKLDRYVAQNGKILISIALGQDAHQMLTVWKEFKEQNHRHFKKFDDFKQAHANPSLKLSNQEQLPMSRAARAKQPYNHSSGAKSFLQRQHKLVK